MKSHLFATQFDYFFSNGLNITQDVVDFKQTVTSLNFRLTYNTLVQKKVSKKGESTIIILREIIIA